MTRWKKLWKLSTRPKPKWSQSQSANSLACFRGIASMPCARVTMVTRAEITPPGRVRVLVAQIAQASC